MGTKSVNRLHVMLSTILLFLAVIAPATSFAQNLFYSVLLDTSTVPSTGCEVDLLGPNVQGIERRLTATVSAATHQVTQTTLESCNTTSGLFDAPVVLGGGYPVALSQGVNGSDAVEMAVAANQVGGMVWRIVFLAEETACEDVLAVTVASTPIPALSWWGMALLVVILPTIAIVVLRRWGSPHLAVLALASISGLTIAAGFMADGNLSDWQNVQPVSSDATGDSSCGISNVDIVAGFYAGEGGNLYFRIDVDDIQPPVAVDDSYAALGASPAFQGNNIVTVGAGLTVADPAQGLLDNDSDPEAEPLSVVAFDATGTSGGTVSVNMNGTFTYLAPPPGPPTDTFTYTVADPGGLEDTGTVTINLSNAILTDGGIPITVSHVSAGAAGANTGTFEDPFNALPATQLTDIVYVYADGVFNNQQYDVNGNQRFLGEGNGNNHTVDTDQLGQIALLPGNGGANRPVISSSAATAVTAAPGDEISNFRIEFPGSTGISLAGIVGDVDVNRTETVGGRGIEISGSNGQFTFENVSITDPTNGGLVVDGGVANVNFDGVSNLTQGTTGPAVLFENGHNGTFSFDGPITATNGTGLQFNNADGAYNFNGTTTLNGGDAGIDILGGSGGTFTFANTNITSPTGDAFNVTGTGANNPSVDFNGNISNNAGNAVEIADTAVGNNITFQAGTIIDNGDGIYLNNVRQDVNFNGTMTLSGTAKGIDILGGTGTFTFADIDITDNTAGAAIDINGGSSQVNLGSASSINQNSNRPSVNIHNGHSGGFSFDGSINATNGDGLQFNNADGTYNFNGTTTLNGGDAGIDIIGGSAGTFTFASTTTITNPTGQAFNVADLDGGAIDYNGSIASNTDVFLSIDTTAPGSQVNFNTTGGNSLTSTNNPSGGIFIFDGDGDITITTPTTFTDPGFSPVFATDGDGTWSFTDMTITDLHGLNGGIDVFGNMGTVNFTNLNITTDSAGTGDGVTGFLAGGNNIINVFGDSNVNADGGGAIVLININTVDMTWNNVSSTNNTNTQIGFAGDDGIDLLNVDAGTFSVTGTTLVDNADGVGISVEDTGATVTFANVNLNDIGNHAIIAGIAFDNSGTLNVNGGTVSNAGGDGARIGSNFGTGVAGFNLNDTTFSGIGGSIANFANSTLSGAGNIAVPFSCNDGGGNTGTVVFNGGAGSCP